MKVPFSRLFNVAPSGQIQPTVQVQIKGVTMSPGVSFGNGVQFGGVNLAALLNNDLEVEEQNGVYVINGYYQFTSLAP